LKGQLKFVHFCPYQFFGHFILTCPKGYFQPGHGASACEECETGKYASQIGSRTCTKCEPGSYADTTHSELCKVCGAGQYQDNSFMADCKNCEIHTFNGDNMTSDPSKHDKKDDCIACGTRQITEEEGSSYCAVCVAGTFFNTITAPNGQLFKQCSPCPMGWFQNETDTTACKLCPLGQKEGANIGSTFCLPCTPGEFGHLNDGDIHVCLPCPPQTYSNVKEQKTSCEPCPSGRSSKSGAVSCSACSAGQMQVGDTATDSDHFSCGEC
jgi:hypothetical protein